MSPETVEVQQFWEQHYCRVKRVWSGRVNARLVEVASDLAVGRALDLGCGEGADAIWLAEHGWQVTAVDVSTTALQRAAADARQRNLLDRIDFAYHDLSDSFPDGSFDLVSAQYLHSPVRLERDAVLRRSTERLNPGGVLLIVDHKRHDLPGIEDVLAALPPWDRLRVESVARDAQVTDNVIVLQRADNQAAS